MEPTLQINEDIKTKGSFFRELVMFVGISIVVILPIRFFIAQPFLVSGSSMEPTFETGEYLIVDQMTYKLSDPKRGDVIIFRYPEDPSKFFIKRIIALPGEKIEIRRGDVTIKTVGGDIIELDEPYVTKPLGVGQQTQLDDTEYFVMGDNRLASADSRTWGPLKEDLIIGRAYLRLFPFNNINYLPGAIE
ncbi:MAG: signal peptidase I [Candidatus Paceibacteria bacterium]|jgi:signal peptidase I